MNDEVIDFSHDAMTPRAEDYAEAAPVALDPWRTRRLEGFGASEVGSLLIALGYYTPDDDVQKHVIDRSKVTNRTHGVARIFAEKAGVTAPLKSAGAGIVGAAGNGREVELLEQWQRLLTRRQWYGPHERLLVPSSLRLASSVPSEWFPLVDRHCPRLTCTPDAWMRDALDGLVMVEAKCTTRERREPRWSWRVQVQAQLAVSGAEWGVIVCGDGWSAAWRDDPGGPIRSWPVERDEGEIARIRAAVAEGWAIVERLRAAKVEAA